jgi:mono/diheme cytochrome c family protein
MNRTNFGISVVVMILLSGCTQSIIPGEYLDSTIPIDSVVTYENQIKSVISQNCIACHSGNNPNGNLRLENYNQVRNASEIGTLIQRINDAANPMPTSGLMSVSTRVLFDEWVNNGFIEN